MNEPKKHIANAPHLFFTTTFHRIRMPIQRLNGEKISTNYAVKPADQLQHPLADVTNQQNAEPEEDKEAIKNGAYDAAE